MTKKLQVRWLALILIALMTIAAYPTAAQQPTILPLAELGPYDVGFRLMTLVDASRDGRKLDLAIWYPAVKPENPNKEDISLFAPSEWGWMKASPNLKAAPYPVIVYSHAFGGAKSDLRNLHLSLVSQGFVVIAPDHQQDRVQASLVDRPLDVLFVIDQLAAISTGDFAGMIDSDHVGVMGASKGAYTALAVTGARIDPASVSTLMSKPAMSTDTTDPRNLINDWDWNKLAAYRAKFSPLKGDELWPPFTDKRIKATFMIAPCLASMFGDKGLAAATVPSFMLAGTGDTVCPYERDSTFTYAHLGSPDRYLLSVIDGSHSLVLERRYSGIFAQFTTAFFGYYLQGKPDYAQFLTGKYVDKVETQLKLKLVWGPYTGE